jgi:hypothetical protein
MMRLQRSGDNKVVEPERRCSVYMIEIETKVLIE